MGLHWVSFHLQSKFKSSNLKNMKNKQFFYVAAGTLGQKLKQLCFEFDRVFARYLRLIFLTPWDGILSFVVASFTSSYYADQQSWLLAFTCYSFSPGALTEEAIC